jgi:diguanylate cyclase (GGDEF)-like protein/PAS domain S-box-containing protein
MPYHRLRRARTGPNQAPRAGAWRVVPLLAAALIVIAAMVVVADRARQRADRARQAQVVMERLRAHSQRLDAITWHSLATQRHAAPAQDVADGVATYRGVAMDLRALRGLGVPRRRLAAIEEPLGAIYGFGIQSIMVSRRDPAASRRIVTTQFSPALGRLGTNISAAARAQGDAARDAQLQMREGWIGSLLAGLLLLTLLGWRLHRIQRSAAVVDEARSVERHAEQRLRALVRHSSDVVVVIDRSAKVRWIAESVRGMLGHEPADLVDTPVGDLLHPEEAHRALRLLEDAVHGTATRGGVASVRLRTADGGYKHVEVVADNLLEDPDIAGVLLNLRDVSDRLELEDQLRHQAFHDNLTGLPNRALFDDRVTQALARLRRHGDQAAVVFIDLDDFKAVNDSLGHAVGDELLRETAGRLEATLRAQDTAARLGGDEFAVLVEELVDEHEAWAVAERIRVALAAPITVGGRSLTPSASIGVACPDASATADTVLGNADVAMYEAKQRGKGRVVAFETAMRERVTERLSLIADLETALERDELVLDYQPVIELKTGEITGVEALVRWEHPVRGRLPPDRFIGLAEASGQIVPIGLWVLETACAQLRRWETERPEAATLEMNVNVSTRQLADPGFPASVRHTLERTGVAAQRLTLEITEYLLLDDSELMQRQLRELKDYGVRLAVDDFGTGYSALSYLQTFPIDVLKIDRSFVSGIDLDAEKARLVQGIVEIGNNLNLRVVTEGIEQPGEAALLRDIDSEFGQGYLFSRPVDAVALAALLASGIPVRPPLEAETP